MFSHLLQCGLIGALSASAAWAADYRVPLMAQPPKLDGKIEPAEWAQSAGFDGFAMGGNLERRRVRAFVGATPSHLYFAFLSQLPAEGELTSAVDTDTVKIVFDDSIEVWIDPTPGSEHGQMFQMLANAVGRQGYKHHARGNVRERPDWRGNWQVANGLHDGYWHCELAVAITDIAPGRTADQGAWGINLCRNWKQPWAFSSLGGGAYAPENIRFTFARQDALAVAHESRADAFVGDLDMNLSIANPTDKPIAVKAEMLIKRDVMPELRHAEELSIEPGKPQQIALQAKDASTRKYQLDIRVTSPDGQKGYYARSYAWAADKPWLWTTTKKQVLPIDIQFAYYPYLNRMRILADVSNLPEAAVLDKLTCTIRKKGTTKAIKTVTFDKFAKGRQELAFELRPLNGEYELVAQAHGKNVPPGELIKPFQRTVYEWEHLGLGTSKKVYPPFTPIQVKGMSVSTVLREHTMNDAGLWEQVIAAGKPLLAGPMRFETVAGGQPVTPKATSLRFTRKRDNEAIAEARFQAGPLRALVQSTGD